MRDLDLVLRGGALIDSTGATRRRADVGIRGGRVVAIGEAGRRDGTGRVACLFPIGAHAKIAARYGSARRAEGQDDAIPVVGFDYVGGPAVLVDVSIGLVHRSSGKPTPSLTVARCDTAAPPTATWL